MRYRVCTAPRQRFLLLRRIGCVLNPMTTRAIRTGSALVFALATGAVLPCVAQQPATATSPAQTAPQPPAPAAQSGNTDLDAGLQYLKSNQFEKALASFQKVLA